MNHSAAQTAMVLSGGGAYGAFAVGLMKVLFAGRSPATNYQPLNPGIFTGTSVGSFNAAIMASSPGESTLDTALHLESIWLDHVAERPGQCGNGIFRLRGDPTELLNPGCLQFPANLAANFASDTLVFSTYLLTRSANFFASSQPLSDRAIQALNIGSFVDLAPFHDLLNQVIHEDTIFRSSRRLAIVATNWITGQPELFDNSSFQGDTGIKAIMASTAIPGVFPPVTIGKDIYVDGGVVENTPLKPAIDLGASELHVIILDPKHASVRLNAEPSTADTLLRFYCEMLATIVSEDIETARWINAGIRAVEHYRQTRQTSSDEVRNFLKVAGQFLENTGVQYKPLTIHIYYPETALGGALGMLDFRLDPIIKMMGEGERIALLHDCRKSGCVL